MGVRKKRAKAGDLIAIPIDEKNYAFGQLVEGEVVGCYIVYDIVSEDFPPIEQIKSHPVMLMAFTNDRFVADGYWKIIGNSSIPGNIKIPEFKLDYVENGIIKCMVSRYDGSILREATKEECKHLKTMKSSYTPNILENAIKAKYGLIPWQAHYDELEYNL